MVQIHSGVTWFEDDDWIGSEISFKHPTVSNWKVTRKIAEHEECVSEMEVKDWGAQSSCRAVFVCSSLEHPGKDAAVKIRMQIPYYKTAHRPPHKRAEQAQAEVPWTTENEVSGLQHLTRAGCSSAPSLLAWKHEIQGNDGWVPGGYIDYILMELVPGLNAAARYNLMERDERDELREALKRAWLDCTACGFINRDSAIRNVVWDRKTQKCYIVDWEDWRESTPEDVWTNGCWIDWNMAWCRDGNYNDMSGWVM